MSRRKGLTIGEIEYIQTFEWDDSEHEMDDPVGNIAEKYVCGENTQARITEDIELENEALADFIEEDIDIECEGLENLENIDPSIKTANKIDPNSLKWRKRDFCDVDATWKSVINDTNDPPKTPYEYFKYFFDDDMLKNITEQTNLYAMQKNSIQLCVNQKEIEQYLGILLYMGIVRVPEMRMLWSEELRILLVADAITRNRFEKIKSCFHCNDNSTQKDKSDPKFDKLHKVRPLLEGLRKNCLKIQPEERNSIDEKVISFKGTSSLKQYNPKKTHKWGFKVFTGAEALGNIYDFALYVGSRTCPNYGLSISSDIVLHLTRDIPENMGFKVFLL